MTRKRKRRRNPRKNRSGLGAFIGTIVGATPGAIARSYPIWMVGWIVGGGVGGAVGAKPDRRKRAAIGGAIGGVLGPLGAALGGYIAGKNPDAKRSPAWVAPVVIVATAAAAGTATALAVKALKKKKQIAAPEPEEPATIPNDAWDSDARQRVQLNTIYRTEVTTFFPNPTLGIIVGQLADPEGTTINAEILSSNMGIPGTVNQIEIFTGNSPGPAEILVQGPAGRSELRLLIE